MKLLLLLLLILILSAQAHPSHAEPELVQESHFISFSTIPVSLVPGKPVTLLFSLEDIDRNRLPGVEASVMITRDDITTLSFTQLRTDSNGLLSLSYAFPGPGDYEIITRFLPDSNQVSKAFSLSIPKELDYLLILELAIAFAIGYGFSLLLARGNRLKRIFFEPERKRKPAKRKKVQAKRKKNNKKEKN